jgi:hypothetical protein
MPSIELQPQKYKKSKTFPVYLKGIAKTVNSTTTLLFYGMAKVQDFLESSLLMGSNNRAINFHIALVQTS